VLSALPAKTIQNAGLVLLVSRPPQSSRSSPGYVPGALGGCMVCYQVLVRYAFIQYKPVLVSTHTKKQSAKPFLVLSDLPFGSVLKQRRFFKTKKEATRYVSYLHAVYKGRIIPNPPLPGGQQYLF
jgi:hypothetical protein